MVNMKVKLTKDEVNRWLTKENTLDQIVVEVAIRSRYHPAGYGMYEPNITFDKDESLVATWLRGESCD